MRLDSRLPPRQNILLRRRGGKAGSVGRLPAHAVPPRRATATGCGARCAQTSTESGNEIWSS